MRILVIGGGGREHALAWKLAQSTLCDKVYACPGNPGIAEVAECIQPVAGGVEGFLQIAEEKDIDLTEAARSLVLRLRRRGWRAAKSSPSSS